MSDLGTRTIPLSSKELDAAIEVLANAGQALRLTTFERISYRALVVSADALLVTFALIFVFRIPSLFGVDADWVNVGILCSVVLFALAIVALVVSLALNVPLFRKSFRERAKLRERGLGALSNFLWSESRRSRAVNLIRKAGLVVIGLDQVLTIYNLVSGRAKNMIDDENFVTIVIASVPLLVLIVAFLVGARYLQNLRERIDLVSNAAGLRIILQDLRQRAKVGVVSVPSVLLERTAKIESTQIAEERKEAVLQSAAFRPNAYAVTFDGDAAVQRTRLGTLERVELEDLVAQLSLEGGRLASSQEVAAGATLRAATTNRQIEIEYLVDHTSRSIRVVNCVARTEMVPAAVNGSEA